MVDTKATGELLERFSEHTFESGKYEKRNSEQEAAVAWQQALVQTARSHPLSETILSEADGWCDLQSCAGPTHSASSVLSRLFRRPKRCALLGTTLTSELEVAVSSGLCAMPPPSAIFQNMEEESTPIEAGKVMHPVW